MAPRVEVVEIPYSKLVDGSCDISQEIIKVLNHVLRDHHLISSPGTVIYDAGKQSLFRTVTVAAAAAFACCCRGSV
jgi:hypothetical protein